MHADGYRLHRLRSLLAHGAPPGPLADVPLTVVDLGTAYELHTGTGCTARTLPHHGSRPRRQTVTALIDGLTAASGDTDVRSCQDCEGDDLCTVDDYLFTALTAHTEITDLTALARLARLPGRAAAPAKLRLRIAADPRMSAPGVMTRAEAVTALLPPELPGHDQLATWAAAALTGVIITAAQLPARTAAGTPGSLLVAVPTGRADPTWPRHAGEDLAVVLAPTVPVGWLDVTDHGMPWPVLSLPASTGPGQLPAPLVALGHDPGAATRTEQLTVTAALFREFLPAGQPSRLPDAWRAAAAVLAPATGGN